MGVSCVTEKSTLAVVVTPTVPTPTTWKLPSFVFKKYGLVKFLSPNSSKSNTFLLFPATVCPRDVSETAKPTLYPRVKFRSGLMSPIS